MERQKHGFIFEEISSKEYNLSLEKNYTNEFDALSKNNNPVQIKCIKDKCEICLGDYFRNKSKEKDFYLLIGFWENEKTNIINKEILYIPHKNWNKLLEFEYDTEIKELLNNITNDYSDDKKWKEEVKKIKTKWGKERLIQLRFKRDHKKQKRIQLAIPYKKFQILKKDYICNEII
jgi:hypothetical protein